MKLFHSFFLFNLFDLLAASGDIPVSGWQMVPTVIVELVPLYTLAPRFILNIRELHARDVQGRHVRGIDTGFGLSSLHGAKSTMGRNEGRENDEEIMMEARTTPRTA